MMVSSGIVVDGSHGEAVGSKIQAEKERERESEAQLDGVEFHGCDCSLVPSWSDISMPPWSTSISAVF